MLFSKYKHIEVKGNICIKDRAFCQFFHCKQCFQPIHIFLSDTRGIDTELKEHIVILLPTVISFEPQKATENLKNHVSATRQQ